MISSVVWIANLRLYADRGQSRGAGVLYEPIANRRCEENVIDGLLWPPWHSFVRLPEPRPKQAIKAREIGLEQETEMKGSSVEDLQSIDLLDVERRCNHDGTAPEA